jgi:error-prone DNA polymerase
VTFMTLEDETGFVNLVVWKDVFEAHSILARTAAFLGVTGKIQSESGVIHLIVEKFWLPELSLEPKPRKSRDFR